MPKRLKASNYQRGWEALYGEYIDITEAADLLQGSVNPERELMRKQEYEALSQEALEMIEGILNASKETLEQMSTPEQKHLSKRRIEEFFAGLWQSSFIARLAVKEITAWVKQL